MNFSHQSFIHFSMLGQPSLTFSNTTLGWRKSMVLTNHNAWMSAYILCNIVVVSSQNNCQANWHSSTMALATIKWSFMDLFMATSRVKGSSSCMFSSKGWEGLIMSTCMSPLPSLVSSSSSSSLMSTMRSSTMGLVNKALKPPLCEPKYVPQNSKNVTSEMLIVSNIIAIWCLHNLPQCAHLQEQQA